MCVQSVYEHACGTVLHMQHWSDLQVALTVVGPSQNKGPDVHWEKVSVLKTGKRYKYINYTDVIEMERLPAISPFTNVVRETSSSVCGVIVASCHMTHITPCHIYSIVLLLYTHSMLEHFMQNCRKMGIDACTLNPSQTLLDQLCEWQRMLKAMTQ